MSVSAKEIAKELGLSQSTVSLALRGMPGISENTRKRVIDKASEMGYQKNPLPAAEGLKFISLVLYKKHGSVLADTPFFSNLIQGIEGQARQCGYQVLITYFYESQNIEEQLDSIRKSFCSGIILLATEMRSKDFLPFETLGIPLVILDRYFPDYAFDCIVINNIHGAKQAVQFLIENGHTHIGYLHSSVEIRNFRERMEGFAKGIRTLPENEAAKSSIVRISPVDEEAFADMNAYLSHHPDLPTAFFADNDNIACACLRALLQAGYRVPEDVSIIGFDNLPICRATQPSLTTMSVDQIQMGRFAVDFLIRRILDASQATIKLEIKSELVVRESVANIRPDAL